MGHPVLTIDLGKIAHNVTVVTELCRRHGVAVTGVTKCCCGDPKIAEVFCQGGLTALADSRLENLKRYRHLPVEKWLIRPPMPSEAEELVTCADLSLHSEAAVLRAISRAAVRHNTTHKVVLMVELGDIREGIYDSGELLETAREALALPGIDLWGLGTNLTCFSFVRYDSEKLTRLTRIRDRLEEELQTRLPLISCGNSATLALMLRGGLPQGANNLRLGEGLLFGKERESFQFLPGTFSDAFLLDAEIVELKEKPSMPWGTFGCDSYGNRPVFTDRGLRRRAILALGRQDIDVETMAAVDPDVTILGASSDHLMVDLTDSARPYQVGDPVTFRLGYFSLMRAYTSPYVTKRYR